MSAPVILVFQGSFCQMNRLELDGIYRFARQRGWNVQTVEYDTAAVSRYQRGQESARPDVGALIRFWNPSGCIVECAGRAPSFTRRELGQVPTVFLDRHPATVYKGAVCVSSDAFSIAQAAAHELLPLGFPHYAYLPWPEKTVWSCERGERFAELVRMNGKSFLSFRSSRPSADMLSVQQEIGEWIVSIPKPCGVFAANDAMAERLVAACAASGIAVPEQIAVIGVDNEEQLCENAAVTISSVRPDNEQAGYRAAALLAEMVDGRGGSVASEVFGALGVVRRASSRLIRNADARVLKAVEFIRCHACEGVAPTDVVVAMGCSRRLADLRFRETMGHTILDEIHDVRLQHVKELLLRPSQDVGAIPDLCGYSSLIDLRRVFKQRTGKTMREWQTDHG